MSKTLALRKLIKAKLDEVQGETHHRRAPEDAAYPYKTFILNRVNLGDLSRDDFDLQVDIWDRAADPKQIEEIADQLETLFNAANLPQATIYPTFYREGRITVDDPDKDIQHLLLTFIIQLYEVEPEGNTNQTEE